MATQVTEINNATKQNLAVAEDTNATVGHISSDTREILSSEVPVFSPSMISHVLANLCYSPEGSIRGRPSHYHSKISAASFTAGDQQGI